MTIHQSGEKKCLVSQSFHHYRFLKYEWCQDKLVRVLQCKYCKDRKDSKGEKKEEKYDWITAMGIDEDDVQYTDIYDEENSKEGEKRV